MHSSGRSLADLHTNYTHYIQTEVASRQRAHDNSLSFSFIPPSQIAGCRGLLFLRRSSTRKQNKGGLSRGRTELHRLAGVSHSFVLGPPRACCFFFFLQCSTQERWSREIQDNRQEGGRANLFLALLWTILPPRSPLVTGSRFVPTPHTVTTGVTTKA